MRFELATSGDEPSLRRLLRESPLPGAVALSLEREPCIDLANAIEGDTHQILVARPDGDDGVVAMGTRTIGMRYVNGVPAPVGYLGQLRVASAHRATPGLLRRGYRKLEELHADGATAFYLTTIVAENEPARRVLEARLPGMPEYRYIDDLVTLLLPVAQLARGAVSAVAGQRAAAPIREDDLESIVACLAEFGARYQFSPVWTLADLRSKVRTRGLEASDFRAVRRGQRLVGCIACWDQRAFKQAVVRGYSPSLGRLRPLVNMLSPLTGSPRLPRVGTAVSFAHLSHLAVADDEPELLMRLVAGAMQLAALRGIEHVSLGLSARSPLLPAMVDSFRCRRYLSRVYVVSWREGASAAAAIDSRPTYLEAATL
jgi:hypothetical protein